MPDDFLNAQIQKRIYRLAPKMHFSYVRRFTIKKKIAEENEPELFKNIRLKIYKLIGRKEE